jgi:signal transduction histidine kinase
LLIVKRCVELHGGSISFDSHQGAGTKFTVRLPLFETI